MPREEQPPLCFHSWPRKGQSKCHDRSGARRRVRIIKAVVHSRSILFGSVSKPITVFCEQTQTPQFPVFLIHTTSLSAGKVSKVRHLDSGLHNNTARKKENI